MKRFTRTTTTTLVTDALKRADDFLTAAQLAEITGREKRSVLSACHNLRYMNAVGVMAVDGTLYWYVTPDDDKRSRTVDERAAEDRPRAKRKPRQEAKS